MFDRAGAIIKGFDRESAMSPHAHDGVTLWKSILDNVPEEFHAFLNEPAFKIEDTTFCVWRRSTDTHWQVGNIDYPDSDEDADGSGWMLAILDGNPATYQEWSQDYHGRVVDIEIVRMVYERQPLTEEMVQSLNGELSLTEIARDIEEIGYPCGAI